MVVFIAQPQFFFANGDLVCGCDINENIMRKGLFE